MDSRKQQRNIEELFEYVSGNPTMITLWRGDIDDSNRFQLLFKKNSEYRQVIESLPKDAINLITDTDYLDTIENHLSADPIKLLYIAMAIAVSDNKEMLENLIRLSETDSLNFIRQVTMLSSNIDNHGLSLKDLIDSDNDKNTSKEYDNNMTIQELLSINRNNERHL